MINVFIYLNKKINPYGYIMILKILSLGIDSMSLLNLKNVNKVYVSNNRKPITVFENITISVNHNEFVSIVGPSGCGKSTLLRIIIGLEPYTSGNVLFKGDLVSGKVNPSMAMVFQSFGLFPWLTVVENIEFGLEFYAYSKRNEIKKEP